MGLRSSGNPDAGEGRDEAQDQVGRDRLADQCAGKQRGRHGIDRNGACHAGWAGSLQREDPEDERQRAAADAEPGTGDPLRRAEAAQHGEPIGQQADGDPLSDEQATRPNGRCWPEAVGPL